MAQTLELRTEQGADKIFLVRKMNMLLEAEGNFLASYDLALKALGDHKDAEKVREFRRDHERHVEELVEAVREMGGEPYEPQGASPAGKLEASWMREAKEPNEILRYFEIGERISVMAYEDAKKLEVPERVRRVIDQALEDEHKHWRWAKERSGLER